MGIAFELSNIQKLKDHVLEKINVFAAILFFASDFLGRAARLFQKDRMHVIRCPC